MGTKELRSLVPKPIVYMASAASAPSAVSLHSVLILLFIEEESRLDQKSFFAYQIVREEGCEDAAPAGEVHLPFAGFHIGKKSGPVGKFGA